jgi:hypothetical protein
VLVLVRLLGAPPTGGTHSSQTFSPFPSRLVSPFSNNNKQLLLG